MEKVLHKTDVPSSIGMTVLLVSWAMMFATLFLVYAVLRGTSDSWPPMGLPSVPLLFPHLSTLIMVLSSFSLVVFQKKMEAGAALPMKRWYGATLFFGILFLVSQKLFWNELNKIGFYVHAGAFSSLIYSFTWIHAGHMVLGILGLLWPYFFVRKLAGEGQGKSWEQLPEFGKGRLRVYNIGKFWHFLGIIWLVMYFSLFIF